VLVKELQSLGLAVEAIGEGGEVFHFGKEDRRERVPRLRTGLNLLGGAGGLGSQGSRGGGVNPFGSG
jgi:DNA-directed RNA polymerase subunit beta